MVSWLTNDWTLDIKIPSNKLTKMKSFGYKFVQLNCAMSLSSSHLQTWVIQTVSISSEDFFF